MQPIVVTQTQLSTHNSRAVDRLDELRERVENHIEYTATFRGVPRAPPPQSCRQVYSELRRR